MTASIPLTRGMVALVDDADSAAVLAASSWYASLCDGKWYARHWAGGRAESMHTFLMGVAQVDHVNGDGLDNRRANLRPATSSQNSANRMRGSNNVSGFKGVGIYRNGRWRACIGRERRQIHLGYFDTAQEAARAYDVAARDLYGEFGAFNFPTPGERAA